MRNNIYFKTFSCIIKAREDLLGGHAASPTERLRQRLLDKVADEQQRPDVRQVCSQQQKCVVSQ